MFPSGSPTIQLPHVDTAHSIIIRTFYHMLKQWGQSSIHAVQRVKQYAAWVPSLSGNNFEHHPSVLYHAYICSELTVHSLSTRSAMEHSSTINILFAVRHMASIPHRANKSWNLLEFSFRHLVDLSCRSSQKRIPWKLHLVLKTARAFAMFITKPRSIWGPVHACFSVLIVLAAASC